MLEVNCATSTTVRGGRSAKAVLAQEHALPTILQASETAQSPDAPIRAVVVGDGVGAWVV